MANWDLVFSYNSEFEAWLKVQGYPHPVVSPSNRMPTTIDIKSAIAEQGSYALVDHGDYEVSVVRGKEYVLLLRGINWHDEDENAGHEEGVFSLRGDFEFSNAFLRSLCKKCGQLVLYPDSGAPIMIYQENHKPLVVNAIEKHCLQNPLDD